MKLNYGVYQLVKIEPIMNIAQFRIQGWIRFINSRLKIPQISVFFFVSFRDLFIHVTNLGGFTLLYRFCLNIMPFIGFVANILKISKLTSTKTTKVHRDWQLERKNDPPRGSFGLNLYKIENRCVIISDSITTFQNNYFL